MNTVTCTISQLEQAREWVMDCVDNPEDVEDASGFTVVRYVNRHYDGGWKQFTEDMDD